MIAPHGDLVIAIRFAINRMGDREPGTSSPSPPIPSSWPAVTRRSATPAMRQPTDCGYFIVFGLDLIVGVVALALYLAMRSQAEYLASPSRSLPPAFRRLVIIWSHLHGFTASADFLSYIGWALRSGGH